MEENRSHLVHKWWESPADDDYDSNTIDGGVNDTVGDDSDAINFDINDIIDGDSHANDDDINDTVDNESVPFSDDDDDYYDAKKHGGGSHTHSVKNHQVFKGIETHKK